MDDSDDQLLTRAVAGDEPALAELLERLGLQLHAELQARIGAPYRGLVAAEDVLQVTFLEAFLRIRSFVPAGPGAFLSWLRRISDNNLRDAIRQLEREKRPSPHKRAVAAPGEDSYSMLLERIPGGGTTVGRAAGRAELKSILDDALQRLPPDYEQVLRLYELEGRSAPEVAQRMGRSHGAVRMLLARARDGLGELLGSASRYF